MSHPASAPALPIIYVRGYAGGEGGIDEAADDAFYGFNAGCTHVRIGGDGEPMFYQFESPLLRLMIDENYELLVRGNQQLYLEQAPDDSIRTAAIWVYRFYDQSAGTFGHDRERFDIVHAAEGLYDFVNLVRRKTESAPRVHLVAHSMGGLVCRTMLQRVCQQSSADDQPRLVGTDIVDRVVTLGTPHGGIETRFALANLLNEVMGLFGSEIFAADNMFGYLTPGSQQAQPPRGWRPNELTEDSFPAERIFCVIGTNAADYGPAKHAVGAKSDGLVRVENAYVRGAPRAFVHRSHSGRYGLVNSEESYQNLRRFLFGSLRVEVHLAGIDLLDEQRPAIGDLTDSELREAYEAVVRDDLEFDTPDEREYWQADVQVTVRGLPIILHEQSIDKHCPVQLTQEQLRRQLQSELSRRGLLDRVDLAPDSVDAPVPLTTVFLLAPDRFVADRPGEPRPPRCRYTMRLRVFRIRQRGRFLGLGQHLEQVADWEDALIVDIGKGDGEDDRLRAWAAWNSEVIGPNARHDPIVPKPLGIDQDVVRVPLPSSARQGVFGDMAHLQLRVTPWP